MAIRQLGDNELIKKFTREAGRAVVCPEGVYIELNHNSNDYDTYGVFFWLDHDHPPGIIEKKGLQGAINMQLGGSQPASLNSWITDALVHYFEPVEVEHWWVSASKEVVSLGDLHQTIISDLTHYNKFLKENSDNSFLSHAYLGPQVFISDGHVMVTRESDLPTFSVPRKMLKVFSRLTVLDWLCNEQTVHVDCISKQGTPFKLVWKSMPRVKQISPEAVEKIGSVQSVWAEIPMSIILRVGAEFGLENNGTLVVGSYDGKVGVASGAGRELTSDICLLKNASIRGDNVPVDVLPIKWGNLVMCGEEDTLLLQEHSMPILASSGPYSHASMLLRDGPLQKCKEFIESARHEFD